MTAVPKLIWQTNRPIPGARYSSQDLYISCPYPEALLEGGRGGGKTSALLMDFAQDCGKGLGADWRGVLFRRSFQDLGDVLAKAYKIFPQLFPGIKFYESHSDYFWEWPTGERLLFRHMKKPEEYYGKFHGHEYPWQGWEELSAWPNLDCYRIMIGCMRSSNPAVAKLIRRRATTNPWGPGHHAVKSYFVDPAPTGHPITDDEGNKRVRYYAPLAENVPLLSADPRYLKRTLGGVDDPNLKKAWKGGADRWEISAGAFFADVWRKAIHVLPAWKPPAHWKITRSFDWGSSAPFACQWYAESPGETVVIRGRSIHMPRGTLVLFAQWYGCEKDTPNVGIRLSATLVARGILEREKKLGIKSVGGVADSSMWNEVDPKTSIYLNFEKEGCKFEPCKKGPGSRVHGWEECRKRLLASIPVIENGQALPLEAPGFYVTDNCTDFIRTLPIIERSPNDPDDTDTDAEDHDLDAWRYRLNWKQQGGFGLGSFGG